MRIAHSPALLAIRLSMLCALKANFLTDWNVKTNDLGVAGKLSLLASSRTIAIANAVGFNVVNITGR